MADPLKMADTFDKLIARVPRFSDARAPRRGEIRVRFEDPPLYAMNYSWFVLDGRRRIPVDIARGMLGGQIIKVDPGEHRLAVRRWLGRPEPLTFRVEAGERVDLCCSNPEEWKQFDRMATWIWLGLCVIAIACLSVASMAAPFLQAATSWAFARLALDGWFWDGIRTMAGDRFGAAILAFLVACAPFFVSFAIWWRREARRLRAEVGPSCSLAVVGTEVIEEVDLPTKTAGLDDWDLG